MRAINYLFGITIITTIAISCSQGAINQKSIDNEFFRSWHSSTIKELQGCCQNDSTMKLLVPELKKLNIIRKNSLDSILRFNEFITLKPLVIIEEFQISGGDQMYMAEIQTNKESLQITYSIAKGISMKNIPKNENSFSSSCCQLNEKEYKIFINSMTISCHTEININRNKFKVSLGI